MRGRADGHIGISRKQTPHWFIPYHAVTAILLCSRTANVDVPRTGLVNGFTLVGSAKVLCDEIHNRRRSTLGTPPCLGGCFQWGKDAGRPSNTTQKIRNFCACQQNGKPLGSVASMAPSWRSRATGWAGFSPTGTRDHDSGNTRQTGSKADMQRLWF